MALTWFLLFFTLLALPIGAFRPFVSLACVKIRGKCIYINKAFAKLDTLKEDSLWAELSLFFTYFRERKAVGREKHRC